jgi:hypothetical protein
LDFFDFSALEDGTDRLSGTSAKSSHDTLRENTEEGRTHFELLFSGSPVPIFSHVFPCHKFASVLRIDIGMQPTTLGFQAAVKLISGVTVQSDQRSILSLADIQLSPLTAAL